MFLIFFKLCIDLSCAQNWLWVLYDLVWTRSELSNIVYGCSSTKPLQVVGMGHFCLAYDITDHDTN